ncbi:MAG: cell division topological specificity factor MinE [Clostridiales bacterium]|jgi:cell division topological specificity factor|nr:cell division topological specificity factor MinE [Clostridiales bacterium]
MVEFLTRLFSRKQPSKDIAKDRLKLVLIHDRANCSTQLLEILKTDIIKVISNYMEIDEDGLDIQISTAPSETDGNAVPMLYANIPIKNIRKAQGQ